MKMADIDLNAVAFPTLDDAQIGTLSTFGSHRSLHDGEFLWRAGDKEWKFFVVTIGSVEISENSSGTEKIVARHDRHAFGGDVGLMTGRPALVSAVARGKTEVFEIGRQDIKRIMSERPVLGEILLRAFIARRELLVASGFQGLRVIGSGSSRDTFRIRDFLARNQVPFTWVDMDRESQVSEMLRGFGLSESDTPVIICGSEPLLRNPSTRALAELTGVRPPLTQKTYDLVIIGGGPAGLAAAVYGSSEGLATVVIDSIAPGGQAGTSSKIENYLGFPTGISGGELANRAILQAQVPIIASLICRGVNDSKAPVFTTLPPRQKRKCVVAQTPSSLEAAIRPDRLPCFSRSRRRKSTFLFVVTICGRACPAIWWNASRRRRISRSLPSPRFPTCWAMGDWRRVKFGIAGQAKSKRWQPLRYLHSSARSLVRTGCPRKSKKTQRDLSRPADRSWIHHIGQRSGNRFFWRQAVPGSSPPVMFGWAQPSVSLRRWGKGRSPSCSRTNTWHPLFRSADEMTVEHEGANR